MKRVAVIGCGGVGSWAAYCVAAFAQQAEEPCKLLLVDADQIESKNLCRMAPVSPSYLGMYKVEAIRSILDRGVTGSAALGVNLVEHHFDPALHPLLLNDYDIVICATDTVEIQRWLHQFCAQSGKRYIRAGYDGETINVTTQFPLTLEDDAAESADAGYHEIPTIFPAIVAGALAAYRVWHEEGPSLLGPLSLLGMVDCGMVPEKLFAALARTHDYHDEDSCPVCDRSHCPDDCDHSECHSSEDCDHSNCIPQYFTDAKDFVESIHENGHPSSRQAAACPYCRIAELESENEELTVKYEALAESADGPGTPTTTTEA